MKSTIRIATAVLIAGAAFGSLANMAANKITGPEIRISDGGGPVYPPGSFYNRAPLDNGKDGSGPVYRPGLVGIMGTMLKDGGGPVYPPGRVS
jgi:hypothetical protein